MAIQQRRSSRLLDYLVFVGPERRGDGIVAGYCEVPEATLLRQFPKQCHDDCCIAMKQVACFCQPYHTYSLEDSVNTHHTFMLRDTETNTSMYGVCYTFPYEVNITRSHDPTTVAKETVLLSVCLLSQHFFLNFFQSCLEGLVKLVEKCHGHLTWTDLFYPTPNNTSSGNTNLMTLVSEIENWINKLVGLKLPASPDVVLEVVMDVGPPLMLSCPPKNELPLCDLPVRHLFQHLQPHIVNEILQLILNEQKVLIYSKKHDVVSKIVFTLTTLLYPLEYVYPLIPLLPSRLSQAAHFLMVPVPYVIGATTDLVSELSPSTLEDVYLVDVDAKKIKCPHIQESLPQLPLNSLELQANIKKILDTLQPCARVKGSMVVVEYLETDKIDMLIRWAFLDFMMSPQMLGLIPEHQTIVRLFPRSVIKVRSTCLLQAYTQLLQHETSFIEKFITSQSVGYFLDWNLNPTNTWYRQLASGKLTSFNGTPSDQDRLVLTLLEADSSLQQLLLHTSAVTEDNNNTDYFSDEDEDDYGRPLSPASPLNNHPQFPNMVIPELRLAKPIVTTSKTKFSDHYHTCQQWVEKLLEEKGTFSMKAQHKQLMDNDSGRAKLLLLIEESLLHYNKTSEVLRNTAALEVNDAVFNKLLLLAKSMIKSIDKDFSKSPHDYLLSAFILLRLTCLVCLKTTSSGIGKLKSKVITLNSPVMSHHATPVVSSISSYTSSSEDNSETHNDVFNEPTSSPSAMANKKIHVNMKYLCHDLFMKQQPQCACFTNDEFWKTVFFSAVNMLREKLGWNEKTSELYQRYLSVDHSSQREMAEEEDKLLNSVLVNLVTFMSITGVSVDKCKQIFMNLGTYCRLGQCSDIITPTLEERMNSKDISLVPLYVKPISLFMAHLGSNKLGTACKVEVWETVLIFRSVSDDDIILRVWRDNIGTSLCDANNELVVLHYKDDRQPIILHTKQFYELRETIIT